LGSLRKFSTGCKGGLLDMTVYPPITDVHYDYYELGRYQWLGFVQKPVPVPKFGRVIVQFKASVETFFSDQSPFPNQMISQNGDDVRLATGTFNVYDFTTGLMFDFFVTNSRIYIGYGRATFTRTPANDYAGFQFLIPVKMRKPCDENVMRVVLNSKRKLVTWFVDGRAVFVVNKVGYYLNRQFMTVDNNGFEMGAFPNSIRYGFGAATLMDNYPACQKDADCCDCRFPSLRQALVNTAPDALVGEVNPLVGRVNPAVFYDNTNSVDYKYWGQGSVTRLKHLIVWSDECAKE
jgi:hypothetical protein